MSIERKATKHTKSIKYQQKSIKSMAQYRYTECAYVTCYE